MFIGIKRFLAAALVTGIGRHLVPVPECENEEGQETSRPRGADLPDDERHAEEARQTRPATIPAVGPRRERRGDAAMKSPANGARWRKGKEGRGLDAGHSDNIWIECY